MKIVVIGGTGLIGRQGVANLRTLGHEAVPASRVNTLTGEGLADALRGAQVVVDVAPPSSEEVAVLASFETSAATSSRPRRRRHPPPRRPLRCRHRPAAPARLLRRQACPGAADRGRGPAPHDRARDPVLRVHGQRRGRGTRGDVIRLSPGAMQPIASADVARAVAEAAVAEPVGGVVEVAGPERAPLAEFVATWLGHQDDPRRTVVDPAAPYFGVPITDATLTPGPNARIIPTRFDAWLAASAGNGWLPDAPRLRLPRPRDASRARPSGERRLHARGARGLIRN